jgi:cell pole-organizing protein PopZ
MTQAAKAQEPSMEEILASIRRIIADDDVSKIPAEPAPRPAAAATPPPKPVFQEPFQEPVFQEPVFQEPALQEPLLQEQVFQEPVFKAAEPAVASEPQSEADTDADILDLTDEMRTSAPGGFRTIDAQPDVTFTGEPAAPESDHLEAARQQLAASMSESLLSSSTTAAVDGAFNALAQTVLVQNARTLEDLVREMLRPMLKTWLDDNLPGLVERLVRAEIERVSRGR